MTRLSVLLLLTLTLTLLAPDATARALRSYRPKSYRAKTVPVRMHLRQGRLVMPHRRAAPLKIR